MSNLFSFEIAFVNHLNFPKHLFRSFWIIEKKITKIDLCKFQKDLVNGGYMCHAIGSVV